MCTHLFIYGLYMASLSEFRDLHSSMLCASIWVFICFDIDLPLWPSGLKHEPTELSLRQHTAITRASFPKDLPLTTSAWPSKHKHSWFKHWYRYIKRWMNYILHLPFRHVAGNLIQNDICFEFLLMIMKNPSCFFSIFISVWMEQLCSLMGLNSSRK